MRGRRSSSFLVLGLPRSGTAWLANFLCHGAVRCAHDLLAEGWHKFAENVEALGREPGTRFAGAVETALAHAWPAILPVCPGARIVIIKRDGLEVVRSLSRMGFEVPALRLQWMIGKLEAAAAYPGALIVEHRELTREETCRRVLEHVAPGEPFDRGRWAMLRNFNVQITPRRLEELKSRAAQFEEG